MMKKIPRGVLIISAAALLAVCVFLAYLILRPADGPQVIETARAERSFLRDVLIETGIIKPQVGAEIKIGSRATGRVMEMHVKVGDRVRAGDMIARIDDEEILQVLEQKKAELKAAQERLRQVRLTYPKRIEEARSDHEYARITYERAEELIRNDYTTRDAVDQARNQFEATAARLKALEEEYRTELSIAEANLKDKEEQVAQQETRLSYTRLLSPIDGIVSEVTITEGETVVTGLQVANLVTILDPTLLEMWIYVDESDIGRVRVGQAVEFTVDTYLDRTFFGTVDRIYPQPVVKDNITYYLAIVPVKKEDATLLKPSMTTNAKVITEEKADALVVPNAAVKYDEGDQVVFRVTDRGKVERVPVRTGIRGEEKTEILSGLSDGDEVATKIILPVKEPGAKAGNRL
ncbi:MAG: efflux RND transporter periplasmic adaptor subunit [Deltaproteobacteria bacterium]